MRLAHRVYGHAGRREQYAIKALKVCAAIDVYSAHTACTLLRCGLRDRYRCHGHHELANLTGAAVCVHVLIDSADERKRSLNGAKEGVHGFPQNLLVRVLAVLSSDEVTTLRKCNRNSTADLKPVNHGSKQAVEVCAGNPSQFAIADHLVLEHIVVVVQLEEVFAPNRHGKRETGISRVYDGSPVLLGIGGIERLADSQLVELEDMSGVSGSVLILLIVLVINDNIPASGVRAFLQGFERLYVVRSPVRKDEHAEIIPHHPQAPPRAFRRAQT